MEAFKPVTEGSLYWLFVVLTTLVRAAVADLPLLGSLEAAAYNDGFYGKRPAQSFRSSDAIAPRFLVNHWNQTKCSPESLIFINVSLNDTVTAPLILSAKDLSMVWTNSSYIGGQTLRPQQYDGSSYLTFLAVPSLKQLDNNDWPTNVTGLMLDEQYNLIHTARPTESHADAHEFQVTNDGGAMMATFQSYMTNHTFENGTVSELRAMDSGFVEVDIMTGKERFRWQPYKDLNLTDLIEEDWKKKDHGRLEDFVHVNAALKTHDGNYLVNSRHLSAVLKINSTTKELIWQLGGKHNMFRDISNGKALDFKGQHNSYFTNEDETEIHMFNNHLIAPASSTPKSPGCSKDGCANFRKLRLNYDEMTVELLYEYQHPAGVNVRARGGSHQTSNGNSLTVWGTVPTMTEISADGESCMELQFGPWSESPAGYNALYRAYKFDWVGTPQWDPSIVVDNDHVYVSWNGATEVHSWALIGGTSESQMTELMSVERQGFETELHIGARLPLFVRVEARDKNGQMLRSSRTVETYPILRR